MTERKPARRPRCTDSLRWPFVPELDPRNQRCRSISIGLVGRRIHLAGTVGPPSGTVECCPGQTSSSQPLGPLLLPKLQTSEHSNRKTIVIVKASKIAA